MWGMIWANGKKRSQIGCFAFNQGSIKYRRMGRYKRGLGGLVDRRLISIQFERRIWQILYGASSSILRLGLSDSAGRSCAATSGDILGGGCVWIGPSSFYPRSAFQNCCL